MPEWGTSGLCGSRGRVTARGHPTASPIDLKLFVLIVGALRLVLTGLVEARDHISMSSNGAS